MMDASQSLLEIRDLRVRCRTREGSTWPVRGVSFRVERGQCLGLVGESGCGKTLTAKAIMQLLPPRVEIADGSILLAPRPEDQGAKTVDLVQLRPTGRPMRRIRGGDIAMIFQEPLSALSPVHTVGNQVTEVLRLHQNLSARAATDKAVAMLARVGIPNATGRLGAFPHELSGGLRQRVMIAKALACGPRVLIADEPTTALDVTLQCQILRLLQDLQGEQHMAMMMITHDLGVIAEIAHTVAVMYLGRIVASGPVTAFFDDPMHPYARGLLDSVPRGSRGRQVRLPSVPGAVPDPRHIPTGCPFHPRCSSRVKDLCDAGDAPPLLEVHPGHWVACHLFRPQGEPLNVPPSPPLR